MLSRSLLLTLFFVLLVSSTGQAGDNQEMIEQLGRDIKQAQNATAKSRLHMYRARHYTQLREWEKALEDYNQALELNHKGWVHLERSQFLMVAGRYDLAYEDAKVAKKELPTLTHEANKIMELAVAKMRIKYEAENPATIIMDTVVDPNRKTRFDVMRERGVLAANNRKVNQYNRKKTATRKQRDAACATTSSG